MHGYPHAEVKGDFHPRLMGVIRLRNVHRDGDPLGVSFHVSDIGNAVGTPEEAEEFLGQTGVTQPHVHTSQLSSTYPLGTSPDLRVRTPR